MALTLYYSNRRELRGRFRKIMQIKINGKPEEIQAKTVLELLQAKDIEPQMVSVELNSTIVDRAAYSTLTLKEGDTLEFLFFMGGGK